MSKPVTKITQKEFCAIDDITVLSEYLQNFTGDKRAFVCYGDVGNGSGYKVSVGWKTGEWAMESRSLRTVARAIWGY